VLFPKNDKALLLTVLRKFKTAFIPKDEYVFKKGELGSEVYFILEGKAAVIDPDLDRVVNVLTQYHFFGEVSLINLVHQCRTVRN